MYSTSYRLLGGMGFEMRLHPNRIGLDSGPVDVRYVLAVGLAVVNPLGSLLHGSASKQRSNRMNGSKAVAGIEQQPQGGNPPGAGKNLDDAIPAGGLGVSGRRLKGQVL